MTICYEWRHIANQEKVYIILLILDTRISLSTEELSSEPKLHHHEMVVGIESSII